MTSSNNSSTPNHDHYIVAIGASAGGLESIHEFFDNMPTSGKLSFIIIQHLSPDYKSLLVELVSKHTDMNVLEAQQDAVVEKNSVYVIPNNKLLEIHGGRLRLLQKHTEKAPNTAIDIFFKSLAQDQGSKAIAIILSGTGTDGTKGAELIHQQGGLVLVQDPISAKFDGMPNHAIGAGLADFILSPELMPEEIFNYINEQPVQRFYKGKPNEQSLPQVLELIEKSCGHDFHNYKSATILRRITRRMGALGKKSFDEYFDLLKENAEECKILGKEFLIGVTKFFRDAAAFDLLEREVLSKLIHSKKEDDVIKIWVTACSTGQEAYSLAILLTELQNRIKKSIEVKIFATDLDASAIEFASKGTYSAAELADMDPVLLNRYFVQDGNNFTVIPSIRKQIVFAKHNILKDPPFIKNDLVTCRNMLIYMNPVLQRRVLSTLLFGVVREGFLFLGPSEIPSSIKEYIDEIDSKWKLYKKVKEYNRYQPERYSSSREITERKEGKIFPQHDGLTALKIGEEFKNALTDEYHFAAIYVDKQYEVKEVVGDFRRYLSLPEKNISLNILKMLEPDLAVALNAAFRNAAKENKKIVLSNVKVSRGDKEIFINLLVKHLPGNGFTFVVFGEGTEALPKAAVDFTMPHDPQSSEYIRDLEEELRQVKHHLQVAVESLETTNEELQSSNEELLSANEELQSSNEELQSLNEELHTLNTEHQHRIRELIELNDDLNNYFRSTHIGQVFIDKNLRIRKFNPTAVQMVNLIESDIGRPIDHISTNMRHDQLLTDIQSVLRTGNVLEKEVHFVNNTIGLMRILPYMRQDKEQDGVVVTFYDITANKQLDNIIKGVFNSSLSAIIAFKEIRNNQNVIVDFACLAANNEALQFLEGDKKDYEGKLLKKSFPAFMQNGLFEKFSHVIAFNQPLHTEITVVNGTQTDWFELKANKMMDGVAVNLTNITQKKISEEKLRRNYTELIKVKENLRELNSGLETKISERTHALSESEERFRLIAGITSDAIWDWNLVNNTMWWSDTFFAIFGYEKSDATNTASFWLNHIHPDDKDRVQESLYTVLNGSSNNWSTTYRFKRKDGSYALITNRASVLQNEAGTPYRVVGSMVDITDAETNAQKVAEKNIELQKANQEFQFVTDFMPQMVWSTTPDGKHDFFNKGWYDFTGLTYDQTKDDNWALVLHPDDYNRTLAIWQHALNTGQVYEVEYRMRRYDGEYRWFLARALPLRDEEGKIVKWFGTCTDINDQRLMNDVLEQKVKERTIELEKTNTELEASNNELLQFASVASHDLKEPLRKIHIFSNLIKDRFLQNGDEGALDYINRVINSSARMTRLINDLLSYSRLSISNLFQRVNLSQVVDEVLSDLELQIKEKKAEIEISELPQIDAVPGQIRQVFQNIVSNALKFSKKDVAPHISIQNTLVEACAIDAAEKENGNFCRIIIQDNGIGFNQQYADKIFVIFQRLHTRDSYEGTGIGLAITKKIIEKHNGLIVGESTENVGTTFTIILPLHQKSNLQQPAPLQLESPASLSN